MPKLTPAFFCCSDLNHFSITVISLSNHSSNYKSILLYSLHSASLLIRLRHSSSLINRLHGVSSTVRQRELIPKFVVPVPNQDYSLCCLPHIHLCLSIRFGWRRIRIMTLISLCLSYFPSVAFRWSM